MQKVVNGVVLSDEGMKAAWCAFHEATPVMGETKIDRDAELMLRLYRAMAAFLLTEAKRLAPPG